MTVKTTPDMRKWLRWVKRSTPVNARTASSEWWGGGAHPQGPRTYVMRDKLVDSGLVELHLPPTGRPYQVRLTTLGEAAIEGRA